MSKFFSELPSYGYVKDNDLDRIVVTRWVGVGLPNPAQPDGWVTMIVKPDDYFPPSPGGGIFKVAQAAPVTLTGTTAETVLATLLIPAGTISAGSVIKLAIHMHHRNTSGCIMRVYANTTANIAGTPLLLNSDPKTGYAVNRMYNLQYVVSTGGTTRGIAVMDVVDALNLTNCKFTTAAAIEYIAVDWSVNQYIVITGQNSIILSEVTLNAAVLTAM